MFLTAKCKKCGIRVIFDVGERNKHEAILLLSKTNMGECPGFHVEFGKYTDYYEMGEMFKTQNEAKLYNKEQDKIARELLAS